MKWTARRSQGALPGRARGSGTRRAATAAAAETAGFARKQLQMMDGVAERIAVLANDAQTSIAGSATNIDIASQLFQQIDTVRRSVH